MKARPASSKPEGPKAQRQALRFHGCIAGTASDKSQKPAMLTDEQTEEFASIIFHSFKQWYGL